MKHSLKFCIPLCMLFLFSCNTLKNPFLGKKNLHEKYGSAIKNAGLEQTALGKEWFTSATNALSNPQKITLPYSETGFFAAERPEASGFIFSMERGQNILLSLNVNPDSTLKLFVDLYKLENEVPSFLTSMDTLQNEIKFTVNKEGNYIVRIQPELLLNVEYTISITAGPSLAFPVAGSGNPQMISFWGNPRDAGARNHEGVDIQANFRAPVLAATEGLVTRVNENNLGGKVVFLRDVNTGNNLYYAHLDSQIAVAGQKVKTGDTLGLIGKTGNARNTVPHLHFGIYTIGGAINPLVFINPKIEEPKKIIAPLKNLNKMLHATTTSAMYGRPNSKSARIKGVEKDEPVFVLSATDNWYKVQSVNDSIGYISSGILSGKSLRKYKVASDSKLLLHPIATGPAKKIIPSGEKVEILGILNGYYLVDDKGIQGWIKK